MNTAARLQQACRDIGHRVLASAALVERLAAYKRPGWREVPEGGEVRRCAVFQNR